MSSKLKIGFLGAGRMATALASGFIKAGLASGENMIASDVSAESRDAFSKSTGASVSGFNPDVAKRASLLFVAVKPAQVREVLQELSTHLNEQHLIVSIAAGVSTAEM